MKNKYIMAAILFVALFAPKFALASCTLGAPSYNCTTQGEALAIMSDGVALCRGVWASIAAGSPESMNAMQHFPAQKYYSRQVFRCRSTSDVYSSGLIQASYQQTCAIQAAIEGGTMSFQGGGTGKVCRDGCQFKPPAGQTDDAVKFGQNTSSVTYIGGWIPTGEACSIGGPDAPSKNGPECYEESGLTQCLREDGKHCATASTGATFCWGGPKENGDKIKDNEYGTKDPTGPKPPATPPPEGEWKPPTNCSTASTSTRGGTTTTSYVCTGGNGTPPIPCTGANCPPCAGPSCPPQPCTGSNCPKPDPPVCDPTKGDCSGSGPAGEGLGDLYTPDDINMGTGTQKLMTGLAGAPVMEFGAAFFGSCSGSGSCPSESWSAGLWGFEFSLSSFCTGKLLALMNFAGYVALAGMALFAFKVALL